MLLVRIRIPLNLNAKALMPSFFCRITLVIYFTLIRMNATQENRGASIKEKETGWNSRGWVPLKYPESAVNREDESFAYFPLHKDVVLACVRELLVLDGTLDSSTLKISENKSHFKDGSGEFVSIPRFSKHMELLKWPRSAEQDEVALQRKRKKANDNFQQEI